MYHQQKKKKIKLKGNFIKETKQSSIYEFIYFER